MKSYVEYANLAFFHPLTGRLYHFPTVFANIQFLSFKVNNIISISTLILLKKHQTHLYKNYCRPFNTPMYYACTIPSLTQPFLARHRRREIPPPSPLPRKGYYAVCMDG